MCVICKEWEKGKLTSEEAFNAINEVIETDDRQTDHLLDLSARILDSELPDEVDDEMDESWWNEIHPNAEDEKDE